MQQESKVKMAFSKPPLTERDSQTVQSTWNVGDPSSIPRVGRSPREGNGNQLQYSCLENPMDRGACQSTVHKVTKCQTWLNDFTFTFQMLTFLWLFVDPWTVVHQAPPSMEFSRQENWSGLPFPSPGDLPDPGIEPATLGSPALAGGFFTTNTIWEVMLDYILHINLNDKKDHCFCVIPRTSMIQSNAYVPKNKGTRYFIRVNLYLNCDRYCETLATNLSIDNKNSDL